MRADHAIAATTMTSVGQAPLPRELADRAAAVPGVSRAMALTATEAKLVSPPPRRSGDDSGAPLYLAVTGADQDALPSVLDLGGNLRPLRPGEIALTSTIMEGQRLAKGRRITLRGGGGQVTLTVAGAYHDPSHVFADQALVSAETMERLDPRPCAGRRRRARPRRPAWLRARGACRRDRGGVSSLRPRGPPGRAAGSAGDRRHRSLRRGESSRGYLHDFHAFVVVPTAG